MDFLFSSARYNGRRSALVAMLLVSAVANSGCGRSESPDGNLTPVAPQLRCAPDPATTPSGDDSLAVAKADAGTCSAAGAQRS